jgi:hypothetical protein
LFLQDGDETTMALKTMPIAKLQDLKSKIEAAINAKGAATVLDNSCRSPRWME